MALIPPKCGDLPDWVWETAAGDMPYHGSKPLGEVDLNIYLKDGLFEKAVDAVGNRIDTLVRQTIEESDNGG